MTRTLSRWRDARDLADLGALTAAWLQGSIPRHPGYHGRPDEETAPLISVLAGLNRATVPYVTTGSQPGWSGDAFDGRPWIQRAAVDGLTDDEGRRRLETIARRHRLTFACHTTSRTGPVRNIPVTLWAGRLHTDFGCRLSKRTLSGLIFPGCHADAIHAARRAWQVTLVDPEWGRDSVRWRALESFTP